VEIKIRKHIPYNYFATYCTYAFVTRNRNEDIYYDIFYYNNALLLLFRLTREQAQETHSLYCYSVNRTKTINFFGMKICRNLLLHFGKNLTKKAFWVNVSAVFLSKSRFFFGTNGQGSLCFLQIFYTFCEQQLNVLYIKRKSPFNN
jgi:hypothetical protein